MSILACIDESTSAGSVLDYAAWAAGWSGFPVRLVHVVPAAAAGATPVNLAGDIGPDPAQSLLAEMVAQEAPRNRDANDAGWALLDAAHDRLATRQPPVPSETRQFRGDLAAAITPMLTASTLVVAGRHGARTAGDQDAIGHNLEAVIRAAHHATLIVPPVFQPVRGALFAYDGSASSGAAVTFLAESGLAGSLTLRLLLVGERGGPAAIAMAGAVDHLAAAGFAVSAEVTGGNPREVLLAEVIAAGDDLLVMGAYGHSRLRTMLMGSTTTALIAAAPAPVLVVR